MFAPDAKQAATGASAEPAISPRRWRIRVYLVVVALAFTALGAWYYLRGSWAMSQPTNPTSVEQGPISQLVKTADGEKAVRASVLIPLPIADVKQVFLDPQAWRDLIPTLANTQKIESVDDSHFHVVTDVTTPLGLLPMDIVVTHHSLPDGAYIANWDSPTGALIVNQGEMKLIPLEEGETLFTYTVRQEYAQYPRFVVNNSLLSRQRELVRAIGDGVMKASDSQ